MSRIVRDRGQNTVPVVRFISNYGRGIASWYGSELRDIVVVVVVVVVVVIKTCLSLGDVVR